MARQTVIQVQCDRCKRVELQPAQADGKTEPGLLLRFGGDELLYSDLCSSCRGAIARLIKEMKEWGRELNQKLLGPAVAGNTAPPATSAPNYTPPKPHKA